MRHTVREADAGLLVLAVVVLVYVGLTLQRSAAPVDHAAAPSRPQADGGVGASTAGLLLDVKGPPRLLVIGDDLAAGEGASTPSRGFARVLADRLDAQYTIDAQADTGFVAPGGSSADDDSFPARARRLVERPGPEPDLVIVEGGHEDYGASPQRLQDAAERTAERLTRAYPDARVVLMGTTRAYPENRVLVPLHRSIRAGAEAAGVPFVDPVAESWITAENTAQVISGDLFHPNDAGHTLLADRLLASLRSLPSGP